MKRVSKNFIYMLLAFVIILGLSGTVHAAEMTESLTAAKEQEAPKYDITINIVPQKGWLKNNSTVDVKVIDNKNTGTFQIAKVEAKIGAEGKWEDITDSMQIEVSEKCSIYVLVTDAYGSTYSQTRYIDGYDTTAPTFNVAVNNGVMTIETNDNESGVESVYVNGYKFKPNSKGKLTVRLQRFDASYKEFTIYCVDKSGNESEPYVIENPYYSDGTAEENSDSKSAAETLPSSGEATDTGESSASVVSVTDEDENDISEDVTTKQFYNIVTKNGQQFYLVIDMSSREQFEGSTDTPGGVGQGTVYFLTYVSNNDLLNLTGDDEVTLGQNSIAAGNNIDEEAVSDNTEKDTEGDSSEQKETDTKEATGGGGIDPIVIFMIAIIVVVVVVFRAKSSGKSRTPVEDELEDDEESIPISELDEEDEE